MDPRIGDDDGDDECPDLVEALPDRTPAAAVIAPSPGDEGAGPKVPVSVRPPHAPTSLLCVCVCDSV